MALYCTHSDESYEKAGGTSGDEKRGGIYDVAEQFKQAPEKMGITVYYSDETHFPHDAAAYRRSRKDAKDGTARGAFSGIVRAPAALVVGALLYAFAASGKMRPALEKWKRGFQEMSGGLFGRKKS